MNVQCVSLGKKVIVKADGEVRILPNFDNIMEILVNENLLDLLRFYYKRDSERYEELEDINTNLKNVGLLLGTGCIAVACISGILGANDVIPDAYVTTINTGAVVSTATYGLLGKYVGSKENERKGILECLKYQEGKMEQLESKITGLYSKGTVVEKTDDGVYVDDRLEKDRLNKILNFIFYMGCHRTKVRNVVKKLQLHGFLRDKFGIDDINSIIEIENYVYREFSDEFEKASGYRIK